MIANKHYRLGGLLAKDTPVMIQEHQCTDNTTGYVAYRCDKKTSTGYAVSAEDFKYISLTNLELCLPREIAINFVEEKNQTRVTRLIQDYAKEVAMVATVLSNNYLDKLINDIQLDCMDSIAVIAAWAAEFILSYSGVTDWAAFCEERGASDWEEFVVDFGKNKFTPMEK